MFKPQFCPSVTVFPSYPKCFRFRTLPGSVAAARRLRCRAASCPATLWLPVWHLTHTRPAASPTSWACRVLGVTWDRLTWAACSGGLACQQPSMRTISTWTLTGRPPVSLHCAWRPKSTVQPYLGRHEAIVLLDGAPCWAPNRLGDSGAHRKKKNFQKQQWLPS